MKKKKIKKLNYDYFIIENFLKKNLCLKIIKELDNYNKFDDYVMNGRNRINKGSNNFNNFLNKSVYAASLFNKLNSYKKFKYFCKKIQFKTYDWNLKKKKLISPK